MGHSKTKRRVDPMELPQQAVYFYADDKKPGDANGDRLGRVWHAVRE